jgi:DnaJ family protein B protein 12
MSSRASGFPSSFGNSRFEGELSPEDLFNMFFGGNGTNAFRSDFGGGPSMSTFCNLYQLFIDSFWPAVFSFSSGGFRTQTFGQSTRTANANANANAEPRSVFVQLLPLIILFGFSLLSALPGLFATPPVPDPRFVYSQTARYTTEMETGGLGIPYYVNPTEFSNHPVIGAELAKEGVKIGRVVEERVAETPDSAKDGDKGKDTQRQSKTRKVVRGKGKKRGPALRKFEDMVDRLYTQDLYSRCQRGLDRKQREKEAEVGIFGIGTDWDKVRKIDGEVIESCEELKRFGLLPGS